MEIKTRSLSSLEDNKVYSRVAYLFSEMYKYMDTKGLVHKLADNGEFLWINTIKKTLGKLNIITIATHEKAVVGFAAGNIRLLPNYLGAKKVGYISHVFVIDSYKNKHIGKKLVKELEDCFVEKSVNVFELEVLAENSSARQFWEKLGYKTDNLRMVKGNEKV
ncbi:GNAT family N-acetyltransferase [Francisella sp. 19X1-34]|uniref:GNAT family N-acetyltransferase n=1 Tax=Francisella sp. 19X1-34 TaxID=3087177 RepID=UPI002E3504F4|nr:GNAT family N-acetyltransferase [Francisella sp. 19X1-34]MED7787521.1 GNAT family N-acetyltransferase [Francisella sp. 19X1-34]